MLQFIHNDFKIDLSHLKLTFNKENIWFKTEINSDYSFPFNMPWDEWAKISNSTHYNAVGGKVIFEGQLYDDGILNSATLKVQETKGKFVSCMIFSGFEDFNVFDKKLKDLPLDNFVVSNIKTHALSVITQDYPAVSHNFPMIHTDKYDPESPEFNKFEKILNKYVDGSFVESDLAPGTNIDRIKNIIQPLPYLLHVLKKGFETDGYNLQGDILNITDFQKALICCDNDYYEKTGKGDDIPFKIAFEDYVSTDPLVPIDDNPHFVEVVNFFKEIVIEKKGDYLLFGDIMSYQIKRYKNPLPFLFITDLRYKITKISGGVATTILNHVSNANADLTSGNLSSYYGTNLYKSVDIAVSFEAGDILRFEKKEAKRYPGFFSTFRDYPYIIDMKIIPIRYRNPDNSPILSILDRNKVDLTQVVPDMTFGELIERLIVWKKLYLNPVGNVVYMNYVVNQLDRNQAVKLSEKEVEEPLITNNDSRSYELLFADGKTHETYKYDSAYFDSDGVVINDYKTKKDTIQISIDALPYPVVQRNEIKTAFAFDNEISKLRLVFYNGISLDDDEEPEIPVCFENLNMLIPKICENDYKDWLNFLINSKTYQWDFIMSVEKFREITAQSLIYAYNNYHIFTEIEQERIDHMYWKISAKTETLV